MPSQMPGGTAAGPEWPPATYASVVHVARVYDYLLGGKDNFAADREAAEQAMRINPDIVSTARASRAFLVRTTSYLAGQAGIRQFLDVGTGMPTNRNVHEVAQSIAPESRTVYVDHDHCKSGCSHAKTATAVRCCGPPVPGCPSPDAAANSV
jgi:hypothetical protein